MKIFTTGQVARICRVSASTVNKWFNSGKLKGFRVPGSKFRRFPRLQLIQFMKEYHLDLSRLEDKILIVTQDQALINSLKSQLSLEESLLIESAASGFECGFQAEKHHPSCVIIDFSIGSREALQICRNLRRCAEFANTILIVLFPNSSPASLDYNRVSEFFKKPFDVALLAEHLRTLLDIRTLI